MPRKPKPKNALSAGERVALYNAEQEEKMKRFSFAEAKVSADDKTETDGLKPVSRARAATKSKIKLPKPRTALVKVDLSLPVGEIKALNGMCNGPVSYGSDITGLFRELNVPYVRFDGADTAISACAVDCSKIFKDMNADPTDPENYDFSVTDIYVSAALSTGAEVIFRLGESVDMLCDKRESSLPQSYETYARVCVNIIKHYNGHFADGFAFGIKYIDIWCCDESREISAQLELYEKIANAIKTFDDTLLVGGMSFSGNRVGELLRYCKKNHVPLDFISLDCFATDIESATETVERCVAQMKNLGFYDTKIILGKWSYIDKESLGEKSLESVLCGNESLSDEKRRLFDSQGSVRGAAYAAALMLRLNSFDEVLTACLYDAQPMISPWCAIADRFGAPKKPFYALKAFSELRKAKNAVLCVSEQADGYAHSGIYACAAVADSGEAYILLSSFEGCGTVDIRVDGIPDNLYTADIYMLDGVKDMTLSSSVAISGMKKRFVLNVSEYGVVMIKLY